MRYTRYGFSQGCGPNVLWGIVGVNVLVFIATTINPEIAYLLGLTPGYIKIGPWTIVTCLFVHAGVWHLIANMVTLYFFGRYLSGLIGERKFLIIYFGGGILGSIFYLLLGPSFVTAVGASGAVFALGGVLAAMRPKIPVLVFPIPVPIPLWVAVIGGFIILSFAPFVAWQAHLGGLVFGLIAGYFFRRRERY